MKIILGITGGIAAYKSIILLRLLKKAGHEVRVVTTPAVSHFVGELTLSTLSDAKVFSGLWEENWSAHVELGLWGDLMVVAPTTANTLAKFANGLCDNALTATYLAAKCPVMIAPAMDRDMMSHPATERNLATLTQYGNIILPTGEGFLASGLEGKGRMLEAEEIMTHIEQFFFEQRFGQPLTNKNVLITAGPTQEAIDPVRYISNHSSGKMGLALAITAQKLGANVTLVLGPSHLQVPASIHVINVKSADSMYQAVIENIEKQDIMIMSAAVADYTPTSVADKKIKKKTDDFSIQLKKTTDILKSVGQIKRPNQVLIGFALETDNEIENALGKLQSKNADMIVLNSMQDKGAGFGHDTNKITLLKKTGETHHFPLKSKSEVALDIWQEILTIHL